MWGPAGATDSLGVLCAAEAGSAPCHLRAPRDSPPRMCSSDLPSEPSHKFLSILLSFVLIQPVPLTVSGISKSHKRHHPLCSSCRLPPSPFRIRSCQGSTGARGLVLGSFLPGTPLRSRAFIGKGTICLPRRRPRPLLQLVRF